MKARTLAAAVALLLASVGGAEQGPGIRVAYAPGGVADGPQDPTWRNAAEVALALSPQIVLAPHGGGGVTALRVRAMHDGEWLAIRLEWEDASADREVGVATFRDAVAVGFPVREAATLPSPFMGDAEHPVNIWQWSADLEAQAEGQGGFAERYPHTEGVWYFPQDEGVRREVQGWRGVDPVVEFEATGWGKLTRLGSQNVFGTSAHQKGRWSVVLRRRLATGYPEDVHFLPGETTQLIVAVWEGSKGDVNGRKSVTLGWTPFALDPTTALSGARPQR
jgi:DMSO reductase family type II enzyme heme b subunit